MSTTTPEKSREEIDDATIRFCGDSGDGMQLAGTQFTNTSALAGNDVATFPDYPAEIRAPRGTKAGVSGFQIHFSSNDIFTPGDTVDALVAMNPAALITNLPDLRKGGILIVNESTFEKKGLAQAGYEVSPLEDDSLHSYKLIKVSMTEITREAVKESGLTAQNADRCRNFFAMGLVFWLYDRALDPTLRFIESKFGKRPEVADANIKALKAGYYYGETVEGMNTQYHVGKAALKPGQYRNIMGNQATAWGLLAAAKQSKLRLFMGAYPITPASDILHELSNHKHFNVLTFQAEDEIAAMCSTIGAAFAGEMAVTASSGPGIALKGEAMGLAVMLELPMIIINVQRGGPSTGLPTKTEQSDLYQAMYGRNGECPMPILAAQSPGDCFDIVQEAWKIAVESMTPVMVLTDGYIANGSEPWRIPTNEEVAAKTVKVTYAEPVAEGETFMPYTRDEKLARPWARVGTPTLEHRIGGLEKEDGSGNVSYDPDNHHHMMLQRQKKVNLVADRIPDQTVVGPEKGDVLILSWGGPYGSCITARNQLEAEGKSVAHAQLRYIHPFPKNLGEVLKNYKQVLIPELNLGQLRNMIRSEFLIDVAGLNKVKGKPFTVLEITDKVNELLA